MIPETAERIDCPAITGVPSVDHPTRSALCPRQWAIQLPQVVAISDLKAGDRERMFEHFRLALDSDPGHVEAAVRLLGHLAADESWAEYMHVARRLVNSAPEDARSFLFLGLGLHRAGFDRDANAIFDTATALLSPEERLVFDDVSPLLTRRGRTVYSQLDSAGRATASTAFFASTDPLFLTEANERRLEHYSRLAWAELKYASPAMAIRGWQSERGTIWVRYGKPWQSYQCCYGGGGRMDYWSYGPNGPVFVFARQLTYRHARHYGYSKAIEEQLSVSAPQAYQPAVITAAYRLPFQLARFRGDDYDLTRVEIYAAVPVDSLGVDVGASLETGLFVFDRDYLNELLARRLTAVADQPRMGLTYGFQMPVGLYSFGLEAREEGPENLARPVGRARDTLAVPGFPEGQLSISDLLLADGLRALSERPRMREDLRIWPSRTLSFISGDPVHVYFEVYGLATDLDGLAQYRVELAVRDAEDRNVVEKIARGVVELFSRGGGQEPTVAWERTVVVGADRSMEYVSVSLPPLDGGTYRVVVRIEDLTSGAFTVTERVFWIESLVE
jgi:GWxTD domain-containing protein